MEYMTPDCDIRSVDQLITVIDRQGDNAMGSRR